VSNFLIISLLFLGVSVSTSWLVGDKEMDTLNQQLEETTAAQGVFVQEVDALKGEIAKKDSELTNVYSQITSLKESRKQYKEELGALQGEKEMGSGMEQAWEEKYGELDARFKALDQRAAELTEELETALLVKTEIERQLRNEKTLRREALERIAQLERDAADKVELLAAAERAGGADGYATGVSMGEKGEGEWWREDVLMYRVKEGDTLIRIAARDSAYGDGEQWRKIYSCNFNVNPNDLYPNQLLIIPPLALVREAGADEVKEIPQEALPAKKTVVKKKGGEMRWAIHIGSYLSRGEAERVAKMIRLVGDDNTYITEHDEGGKHWYRVRVGFYPSQKEAARNAKELSTRFKIDDVWAVLPTREEVMSHSNSIDKVETLNNI
jgi:nucleoid-associated protein YgaU